MKFCQTRWVEGKIAAERALDIFTNVCQYIEHKNTKLPSTTSVKNVQRACADKLMMCKISFFARMASLLEVFLIKYQSGKPLTPFLYGDIKKLLLSLLGIILKKNVIPDDPRLYSKIDLDNQNNFLDFAQTAIGFATQKFIKVCKASEKDKLFFLKDVRAFVLATIKKILEKSPLKRKAVKAISCLDPSLISSNISEAILEMQVTLEILFESNKIRSNVAESCLMEFKQFCESEIEFIKLFNDSNRLDSFYWDIIEPKFESYKNL